MVGPLSTPIQRSAILDSALAIISSKGMSHLTVRRVAEGAGCSTTGVYTWFGGKNGLLDALQIDGFESFDAAVYAETSLIDGCRTYRRWALENPAHYLVMFGASAPDHAPSPEAQLRALDSYRRMVEVVRDRHHTPSAGDTVERDAHRIWATIHGHVMLELAEMRPLPPAVIEASFETTLQELDQLVAGS